MRNLGTNMAWLLKCIEAGKAAGVEVPPPRAASGRILSVDKLLRETRAAPFFILWVQIKSPFKLP